jgi:hypothetical protein
LAVEAEVLLLERLEITVRRNGNDDPRRRGDPGFIETDDGTSARPGSRRKQENSAGLDSSCSVGSL